MIDQVNVPLNESSKIKTCHSTRTDSLLSMLCEEYGLHKPALKKTIVGWLLLEQPKRLNKSTETKNNQN